MKINHKYRKKNYERENDKESGRIATILFSLVAAGIIFLVLISMEKDMLSNYEKGTVVVAKTEIPEGTIIMAENMQTYLKELEVEKRIIPSAALSDMISMQGFMFSNDVDKDSFITNSFITDINTQLEALKEPVITGIRGADISQVASGTIRGGDVIHIYVVTDDEQQAMPAYENIFVAQVFDASGSKIEPGDKTSVAQVLNIILEKDEIEGFYAELAGGNLQIVKVY